MKLYFTVVFLFGTFILQAQTKEQWAIWQGMGVVNENDSSFYKKDLKKLYFHYNFSPVWLHTKNINVLGYMGNNFQRLRIKFISVLKDSAHPDIYFVDGKSMAGNTVCGFRGKIKITDIKCFKDFRTEDIKRGRQIDITDRGVLFGDFIFYGDSAEDAGGAFKGSFVSCWYANDSGKLRYDDLDVVSGDYCNNQFAGTWQKYGSKVKEICAWGDFRIPFSGDLDNGVTQFSPTEKYFKYGWDSYNTELKSSASQKEAENWWK